MGAPVLLDPLACSELTVFPFDPYVLVEYEDGARVWSTRGELPRPCGGPLPSGTSFPSVAADGSAAVLELDLRGGRSRTWAPPWDRPAAWTPMGERPERLASLEVCMLDGRRLLVVGGLDGSASVWDLDAGEHRLFPAANDHSRPVERVVTGGPEQKPLAVLGTSGWGWDDFTMSTLEFFFAVVYDVALGREVFQVPCLDVDLVYALGTAGA
ncbi:hypothetical protein [Actinomadura sp. HBU206391]|uniref:hypothetical protein n=1 Tax=Actinomadura sp. HBU206391 TaxID=2731692 RepID=UPI001650CB67|nr:hypothetical protein [Actinomadura sp. HBU206391]MBC6457059.1 hypothetical protein [Actinomadura sp. HBU206391]